MNCAVTAGPTCEPLDAVRSLTNFSTGRLGTILADYLTERGHSVVLLKSRSSLYQPSGRASEILPFSTSSDLAGRLESLRSRQFGAVFHAAAVSDFAFGKIWAREPNGELREAKAAKITSQTALLAELLPTPKIIARLHSLFPNAFLVGWKYEADGEPPSVLARAKHQMLEHKTHACVMNGPAYGDGFGVLTAGGESTHHGDLASLCRALADLAERHSPAR